ncbi:MAG TPA: RNA methyltransferase [Microthrixaceae bacterium]|nr:RNA methyltransferase [Microthrixaceae bacterium]
MLQPTVVTDPGDPRVADFRGLDDARYRRRVQAPTSFSPGQFVIEGWLALERALETRQDLRGVLVLDARLERLRDLLGDREAPVFVADAATLEAIVGFDLHRGVVAVATRRPGVDPSSVIGRAQRMLIVEGVNDGENLGALFRNAAALGAEGVLLDPTSCDPLTRRTVRVSLGHVMAVPYATRALSDGIDAVRAAGHRVVALSPRGDADLRALEPSGHDAVLVGAEGSGLGDASLDAADVVARIPMAGDVDSLNVATAAAIAMWHLFSAAER